MNTKEFVAKYGTVTASLVLRKVAKELPANAQASLSFYLLLEFADDLEQLLKSWADKR